MIKTYRIKETVQALLWTGKNKEELEIFVGEENLEWTLSTIKPPIPEIIKNNLEDGIQLDFEGFNRIPTTFLNCLLSDLIEKCGRKYISKQVDVKNLSNTRDFSRVVLGTTF